MSKWRGQCARCDKWVRNDPDGYDDDYGSEILCKSCAYRNVQRGPESPIEHRFLVCWQNRYPGVCLETQLWIGNFRVDFALPAAKIVIELDGKAAHEGPDRIAHDQYRQRYLEDLGFYFIRFTGSQINRDTDACVLEAARLIVLRLTQRNERRGQ